MTICSVLLKSVPQTSLRSVSEHEKFIQRLEEALAAYTITEEHKKLQRDCIFVLCAQSVTPFPSQMLTHGDIESLLEILKNPHLFG